MVNLNNKAQEILPHDSLCTIIPVILPRRLLAPLEGGDILQGGLNLHTNNSIKQVIIQIYQEDTFSSFSLFRSLQPTICKRSSGFVKAFFPSLPTSSAMPTRFRGSFFLHV